MSKSIPDGLKLTPFDETFYHDPYPVYAQLREQEPVHKDQQSFYEQSWTICDYESVKNLLADPRLSADPRTIGLRRDPRADNPVTLRDPNMMNLDNPEHHRLRSLVHKAFTPSSVAQFKQQITKIVDSCLDRISTPQFDIVTHISKPIPTITIAQYIGIPSDRHLDFKRWTDSLTLQGYPVPTQEQWNEIVEADSEMRNFMSSVVASRTLEPQDDLVSRLILSRDDSVDTHSEGDPLPSKLKASLTPDEVVEMCFLLVGAGNFTTTDLISNTLFTYLTRKHREDRTDDVSNEAGLSDFVSETLRYDSPVLGVRRYVTQTIEVLGRTIEAGSVVNLVTGAANHDPKFASHPDRFDASRSTGHISFGRGIHHCLGAPLAKLETQITLERFSKRFPNAKILSSKRSRRMDFRGFSSLVVEAH